MKIIKNTIAVLLIIPYIICFGAISYGVDFPDGSKIYYDGWLI